MAGSECAPFLVVFGGSTAKLCGRAECRSTAARTRPAELCPLGCTIGPHKSPPHGTAGPRTSVQIFKFNMVLSPGGFFPIAIADRGFGRFGTAPSQIGRNHGLLWRRGKRYPAKRKRKTILNLRCCATSGLRARRSHMWGRLVPRCLCAGGAGRAGVWEELLPGRELLRGCVRALVLLLRGPGTSVRLLWSKN